MKKKKVVLTFFFVHFMSLTSWNSEPLNQRAQLLSTTRGAHESSSYLSISFSFFNLPIHLSSFAIRLIEIKFGGEHFFLGAHWLRGE